MKEKSKVRSLKLFVLFLAIMFVMTFVSRMLYTQKMPRVTTTTLKTQALSHEVRASGSLEAVKKTPVFVPDGLRVAELCVNIGDEVEQGDELIRFDPDYINEKINSLENEISSDRQTMSDIYADGTFTPVFSMPGLRVREVCVKVGDTVEVGQDLVYLDTDYLSDYIWDLINQMNANICQRDAYYDLGDTHAAKSISNTIDEQKRKYNAYNEIAKAGGVIHSNSCGTVTQLIKAGDLTSDTAVALISSDAQLNSAIDEKQQRLDKLRELLADECIVKSPVSGVVMEIAASVGSLTDDTSALTISDISQGFVFCAQISEEDTKYISVGDSVRISFRNGKKTLTDCTVKLITKNEGDSSYKAVIPLEDTELLIGEIGELSVSTLSKNKSGVVPLSAVTIENGKNGHIYVLEEVEGFLGVELIARKINVQVEDSNDYFYALPELGIDPQAKIVVSSTKKLSDGQRVIGLHI